MPIILIAQLIRHKFSKMDIANKKTQNNLLNTPRQKSIRALEIFRVQKLILNATS